MKRQSPTNTTRPENRNHYETKEQGTMSRNLNRFALLVVVAALAVLAASGTAHAQENIAVGKAVSGEIAYPGHSMRYAVHLNVGDLVSISMDHVNGDLDPWLDLYWPNESHKASDDDGGHHWNALIKDEPIILDGYYTIIARSYGDLSSGRFRLTVTARNVLGESTPARWCECVDYAYNRFGLSRLGGYPDAASLAERRYARNGQRGMEQHGFFEVSPQSLRQNDVLIINRSSSYPSGHFAVYTGRRGLGVLALVGANQPSYGDPVTRYGCTNVSTYDFRGLTTGTYTVWRR